MNDLLKIVEELTNLVEELNPGATEQIRRIRLLIEYQTRRATSLDDGIGEGPLPSCAFEETKR